MSKRKSQRENGFKGGVKEGSSATTPESRKTESILLKACRVVSGMRDDVYMERGLSGKDLAIMCNYPDEAMTGMRPDGGVWYDARDGKLLFAAEAKKQGVSGNAIERWAKNYTVFRNLGVTGYFTLCTGAGFFEGGTSVKIMQSIIASIGEVKGRVSDSWNKVDNSLMYFRYRSAKSICMDTLVNDINKAIDRALEIKDLESGLVK
ncbi:MAG: hypothetical protein ACKOW9_05560 [Candidatus Paceibacterota bacterium]